MKLACVIHRYGAELAGGSEAHCRAIAHQLAARHVQHARHRSLGLDSLQ